MADNINAAEGAMGWDDQIENEGQEFILLDDETIRSLLRSLNADSSPEAPSCQLLPRLP